MRWRRKVALAGAPERPRELRALHATTPCSTAPPRHTPACQHTWLPPLLPPIRSNVQDGEPRAYSAPTLTARSGLVPPAGAPPAADAGASGSEPRFKGFSPLPPLAEDRHVPSLWGRLRGVVSRSGGSAGEEVRGARRVSHAHRLSASTVVRCFAGGIMQALMWRRGQSDRRTIEEERREAELVAPGSGIAQRTAAPQAGAPDGEVAVRIDGGGAVWSADAGPGGGGAPRRS